MCLSSGVDVAIDFQKVKFSYGEKNFLYDFKIFKGEKIKISGRSGSGKTTLLNCLSGFITADSGKVLLDGQDILTGNETALAQIRQHKLGFVFQDYNIIEDYNVFENVNLSLELQGKNDPKLVGDTLNSLGLACLEKRKINELSGGQKQRVAIARALVKNPSLILADEPTGNLDSKATKDVMNLLKTLNKEMDSTILMVTHDAYVASMCHRVLFIKDGRIYQEIVAGDHESEFYQRILDMLTFLGGDHGDVNANRL